MNQASISYFFLPPSKFYKGVLITFDANRLTLSLLWAQVLMNSSKDTALGKSKRATMPFFEFPVSTRGNFSSRPYMKSEIPWISE